MLDATPRVLGRDTLNELQALVRLAPLAQTDLRAEYSPQVFAMDASPYGAGIVAADVQRGFYTRLENPAAVFRELGLEADAAFGSGRGSPSRVSDPGSKVSS